MLENKNYKTGSTLICKKTLSSHNLTFYKNKKYIILDYFLNYFIIGYDFESLNTFSYDFFHKENSLLTINSHDINEHFYTEKELREYKLSKLNKLYETEKK